jgi:hypothetical protein
MLILGDGHEGCSRNDGIQCTRDPRAASAKSDVRRRNRVLNDGHSC